MTGLEAYHVSLAVRQLDGRQHEKWHNTRNNLLRRSNGANSSHFIEEMNSWQANATKKHWIFGTPRESNATIEKRSNSHYRTIIGFIPFAIIQIVY